MAKPKQILTDNEKKLILAFYELGRTDKEIADIVGLPRKTFTGIIKYNDLTATIKKGIADSKVEASLYSQALAGNVTAQIFWLCNRVKDRWQNVNKVEHGLDKNDFDEIFDRIKGLLK